MSGSERSRIPVALKIALPMAGAMPTIGVPPAPAGRQTEAIEQHDVHRRDVAEARHGVLRKPAVGQLAVPELDRLEEQRAAEALNDQPFHLVAQPVRVHDRVALESDTDAIEFDICAVDFNAARDVHLMRRARRSQTAKVTMTVAEKPSGPHDILLCHPFLVSAFRRGNQIPLISATVAKPKIRTPICQLLPDDIP